MLSKIIPMLCQLAFMDRNVLKVNRNWILLVLCVQNFKKRVSDLQQQFKQAKATIEEVKEKAFDIKTSKKFNILFETNQTPRLLHPYKTFGILDIIVKGCSLTLQTEEFTELVASKDLRKKSTNKS